MRITKPTGITLLLVVAFFVTFSALAQTAPAAAPPAAKAAAPAAPAAPPAPAAAPPAAKAAAPAAAAPVAGAPGAAEPPPKVFDKTQTSYALGTQFAMMIHPMAAGDIDVDNLAKGFADKIGAKTLTMSDEDIQQAMMAFTTDLKGRRMDEVKKVAEANKAEGAKYLEENGKKEGVTTLPSGLQYKVIKEGTGPMPVADDQVKVEYKGTFVDGKEFDKSRPGQPATLPVNRVIPGWTEALQKMKVGSTWQLAIPGNLAYGDKPPQQSPIPPSKMLLFEVTLVEILPKEPAAQPGAVTLPNQPATAPPPAVKPAEPAKGSS